MKLTRLVSPLILSAGLLGATSPSSKPLHTPPLDKRLEAWLPHYGDGFDPSRHHRAVLQGPPQADDFVGHRPIIGPNLPAVFGHVGPKGSIAFDYAHDIAFYEKGCCAYWDRVLAFAHPPPRRVTNGNLIGIHTKHGISLGETVAVVRKINGYAVLQAVRRHAALRMLSYAAMNGPQSPTCGQFRNYVFQEGRLVFIELLAGC